MRPVPLLIFLLPRLRGFGSGLPAVVRVDVHLVIEQFLEHPAEDLALVGEGFFAVERRDGTVQYTRNGAFDIGLEGEKRNALYPLVLTLAMLWERMSISFWKVTRPDTPL